MNARNFRTNVRDGDVLHKSGYHQPDSYPHYQKSCGCKKTTDKGAYRDVSLSIDGHVIHYYHQTPVVVVHRDTLTLRNGGWDSRTTKDRIRGHLPPGYDVVQRDFDWYVSLPNGGECEYQNGMVVNLEAARIEYLDGSYIDLAGETQIVEAHA